MSTDDKNETEVKKIDDVKPVVWTPEDASRFLTSAINEAQRPLADALKNRPITSKGLYLLVGSLLVAGLILVIILSGQIEKAEQRAASATVKHEQVFAEKHEIQAQHNSLQDRLTMVNDQHEELRGQVDTLRQKEEVYRKAQMDLSRFRRHNDALRSQISGLEMEKAALSRQLDALKVLMAADDDEMGEPYEDGEDEHPFDGGYAIDDQSGPEQAQPHTTTAPDAATPSEAPAITKEDAVSETSSISTGEFQEKQSLPEQTGQSGEETSADTQDKPATPEEKVATGTDAESYSEQAAAISSILSVAEEIHQSGALLDSTPDKYQALSDSSETTAETVTDSNSSDDHFAATSAAYGESLSSSQPLEAAPTAELLEVDEVAETSEGEGEKSRLTPAEFVEKIGQVVEQIREKVTP